MATKKGITKTTKTKSTIIKIAETIGMVAGEISVKKDQVVAIASNVIGSVKNKMQDKSTKKPSGQKTTKLTAAEKTAIKKPEPKKSTATVGPQTDKKNAKETESKKVKNNATKKAVPVEMKAKDTKKKSVSPGKSASKKSAGKVVKSSKTKK